MWFNRWRVEEDLERIRKANLADMLADDAAEYDAKTEEKLIVDATKSIAITELDKISEIENSDTPSVDVVSEKAVYDEEVKVGAKDIFAMIIAVFSLLLPFIITMIVVMGLFLLFLFRHVIF